MECPQNIKLTQEIITQLGFGDYWGDAGESGTRYLTAPGTDGPVLMRIHDVDEMQAGSYGYGWVDYSPQCLVTDKWEKMDYLHELLNDADKNFPNAITFLMDNIRAHDLFNQGANDKRSVATDGQSE